MSKSTPSPVLALLLASGLLALLAPRLGEARPERDPGLRTGSAHLVVVSSSPASGLEAGLARDSSYGRGIALDAQGRFEDSLRVYQQARTELEEQLHQRPRWAALMRGWLLKVDAQIELCRRLKPLHYFPYTASSYHYYRTGAKHAKWLAIRAFTGQAVRWMQTDLIHEYERILQQQRYVEEPRIALAALYHEIGRPELARREFVKIRDPERNYLAREVAHYYTAMGDIEQAFTYLARAVKYSNSNRRAILQDNAFDRLRSDPRFAKLVGAP